jgi:leucyl/phenylalanyl-tRNA--protein transferase
MTPLTILRADRFEPFPPVERALRLPNGLLAVGGDLTTARLLEAYRHGIFPWYTEGEPILWWSPDPRTVFATDGFHIARRWRRWLRSCAWTIRADRAFVDVIRACAAPRRGSSATWITAAMQRAYGELHDLGYAHSIEVYDRDDTLIGGLYGVAIGRMFFGESMFSRVSQGSKVALLAACRVLAGWGFPLLDAQLDSPHLQSLGAFQLPRRDFVVAVARLCAEPNPAGDWRQRWPQIRAADLIDSA